ncbi:hypothetical protein LEP1GSC132_0007 [Leptospira kirschneri str. 200803703]|uniref:hypothetical protein n=1 Tax=Leptospira kirschneri TaxID=29507 RepID=UPI0002BD67DD|nr:hypothetical protein [Leptospira kirschneri]EMO66603.1 hypothetical protein LEP1GSC132_0007 [Leptospira kirschneri str. 200803703]
MNLEKIKTLTQISKEFLRLAIKYNVVDSNDPYSYLVPGQPTSKIKFAREQIKIRRFGLKSILKSTETSDANTYLSAKGYTFVGYQYGGPTHSFVILTWKNEQNEEIIKYSNTEYYYKKKEINTQEDIEVYCLDTDYVNGRYIRVFKKGNKEDQYRASKQKDIIDSLKI